MPKTFFPEEIKIAEIFAGKIKSGSLYFAEIAPVMQLVRVLKPAVADVFPVIHVRDADVVDPVVNLRPRLLHCLAGANNYQYDSRIARDNPFMVDKLHVLYVDALKLRFPEQNHGVLRVCAESFRVIERERRHNNPYPNLKAAPCLEPEAVPICELGKEFPHRREHAFLLDAYSR